MRTHRSVWSLVGIWLAATTVAQPPAEGRVRGITISTHGNGDDWARDGIVAALGDVQRLGGNWVAIHPYARIRDDGRVDAWQGERNTEPIARPIREAHALGLKIMVVPHLAHWGSRFRWRGEIEFPDGDARTRFFAGYTRWLVAVAEIAAQADAIAVGSELDRTVDCDGQWRAVIAAVRAQTKAPLTYGANWTDYARVPFWDALDAIGIQAYFPLVERLDPPPTRAELDAAWVARMAALRAFSLRLDRHIVFTELGYNRAHAAAATPWAYRVDGDDALPLQARCLAAALQAIEAEPRVVGCFLWKWFPPPRRNGRDFPLATPSAQAAIAEVWPASPGRKPGG